MMRRRLFIYMLILATIVLTGCDKDERQEVSKWSRLVSYEKIGSMSANESRASFKKIFPTVDNSEITEDIDYYRIVYKSNYLGETVELSGLVLFPTRTYSRKELQHFQYQHYTLYPFDSGNNEGEDQVDAPSLFNKTEDVIDDDFYEVRAFGINFASRGYFVSMPDYDGYGLTQNTLSHLYCCNHALAKESYDMLIAAREMAQDLSLELTSNVSLCGWSEGSAVSLYLQKLIEDDAYINVKVNTCLAGSYMSSEIPSPTEENKVQVFYTGWITLSHCMMLDVTPNTYFTPIVTDINKMLEVYEGSLSLNTIFNQSTIDNNYEHIRKMLMVSNTASGWGPKGTVHLFHGQKDMAVPYYQSTMAMDEFAKSSVPEGRVVLHTYPEGDHENFADDFIVKTLELIK